MKSADRPGETAEAKARALSRVGEFAAALAVLERALPLPKAARGLYEALRGVAGDGGRGLSAAAYTACARAFDELDEPAAALRLLERKPALEDADYALFFHLHRRLKSLEAIDPLAIPAKQRVHLANALFEIDREARALKILDGLPRREWGKPEYSAAVRICERLGGKERARELLAGISESLTPGEAAELRYYLALLFEKWGERETAKAALRSLGAYKDAALRLKTLEAASFKDIGRADSSGRECGLDELGRAASGSDPAAAEPAGARPRPGAAGGRPSDGLVAGKYRLLKELRSGGMGVVYKAQDTSLDCVVALKRIKDEIAGDAGTRAAFLEEARTLAALEHPGIVSILAVFESEGEAWIACRFVDGENLGEIIARRGSFGPADAVECLRAVCAALAYAHGKGVIHRDLKPLNIMQSREGQVKIMDFGFARRRPPRGGEGSSGAMGGTPEYMAPEQHEGKALRASDLFSLGVTAYELLSGRRPFGGEKLREQKRAGRYAPLPGKIPERLRLAIAACLKPAPKDRPKSAHELSELLARAI